MAKIEMPEGTKLGAYQSWNAQHGYVQTDSKHCDEDALKAAYNAAGRPAFLTWIKEQSAEGVALPSYPTCVIWMETRKGAAKTASTSAKGSSSSTGINLEAEFQAHLAQQQASIDQQRLDFFIARRDELAISLKAAEGEIRTLKTKMGIVDPIVEG